MKLKLLIGFSIFLLFVISCNSLLHTEKNILRTEEGRSINLYAFVGKKISVTEFNPNAEKRDVEYGIDDETGDSITIIQEKYIMDRAFLCKYQVIKNMFNHLENDTVEFTAYDHYGTPGFAESDTVILYISTSKDSSHYFHQKYQYDRVFKNKKGNYFTYPKFNGNEDSRYANRNLTGFKINFTSDKYEISHLNKEVVKIYYPSKFYKIENNFAIPKRGIYLEQQINYRLQTTFKDFE